MFKNKKLDTVLFISMLLFYVTIGILLVIFKEDWVKYTHGIIGGFTMGAWSVIKVLGVIK